MFHLLETKANTVFSFMVDLKCQDISLFCFVFIIIPVVLMAKDFQEFVSGNAWCLAEFFIIIIILYPIILPANHSVLQTNPFYSLM